MMNTATARTATAAAVTVDRKALVDALKLVGKVTERRNTIPVLSMTRLSVSDAGALELLATDLDLEIAVTVEGAAAAPGAMLVDTHALKAAAGKAKGERVRLADAGGGVTFTDTSNGATVRLATLDRDAMRDYPRVMLKAPLDAAAVLDAAQLRDDWTRAAVAISTEETRYYLNGILAHLAGDGAGGKVLRYAATDGHRLVRVTRPVPASLADHGERHPLAGSGCIIPRKAVAMVRDIIGAKGAGEAVMTFDAAGTKVEFQHGATVLRSKLVDGTFPDYSRVIPVSDACGFDIAADALADTLAAVTGHLTQKAPAVAFMGDAGWMTAATNCPDNGRAGVLVDANVHPRRGADGKAAAVEGTRWNIGFNASYLSALAGKAFGGGTLAVRFHDAASPALLTSDAAPHVLAVLMPMRTDGTGMTPEGVRSLHRTPVEALADDLAREAAAARDAAKAWRAVERAGTVRKRSNARGAALAVAWGKVRTLVAAFRSYLAGSLDGRALRLAVKAAVARALEDAAALDRAEREAAAAPCGTFGAIGGAVAPAHAAEAVEAPAAEEDAPAPVPAPEAAPAAPVAANDDAASVDPMADRFEAAAVEASAAMDAAGYPAGGEDEAEGIWCQYAATVFGAAGPDGWAIETGRKQADRKARNRGKVLVTHDAYRIVLDRFHALFPALEANQRDRAAAGRMSATLAEMEAACPAVEPVTVEAPCPRAAPAPADDLAATVAALAARVAVLEARPAAGSTARPPRTAAQLRMIRAYLRMRAERVQARAALAAAVADAAQARTNEAAIRAQAQAGARDAMRLQEQFDAVRDDACKAEVDALRLRGEVERLEHQLAESERARAADRAELQRLAPVVNALAALNPAVTLAAAA